MLETCKKPPRCGSGFSKNNRVIDRNYEMWSFFTGTAQPPLPLQEFLPAQPLSPDLQPPLPLQEFWPLQSCLAPLTLGGLVSSAMSLDPATIPAVTVPRAIANFLRFIDESLLILLGPKNGRLLTSTRPAGLLD